MNATLLGLNAASMGYFFMDPSLGAGLGCLGAATVLSTTMGATLTAAIGGIFLSLFRLIVLHYR